MFQLLLAVIYLAFISLGLPDSLLGSAWPAMYQELSVPVSYAGGISMIIAVGTVISSLQSDRLTGRYGTGKVTAFSVLMTAAALFGFSVSHSYAALCLWAVPYGLGAGSVDASLNNYVALHYESRHMSWLHCMWGVGASLGPYVMGYALSGGQGWNMGYRSIAVLQIALTVILFLSLPLWDGKRKSKEDASQNEKKTKPLSLGEIVRIPGAKEVMAAFFCYCALEQTAGLWASSYLVLYHGLSADTAAGFAGLFFVGITVGRAFSGFLTLRLHDIQMIRLGQGLILSGIISKKSQKTYTLKKGKRAGEERVLYNFVNKMREKTGEDTKRIVVDYIAGQTDKFFLNEARKLFPEPLCSLFHICFLSYP